VVHRVFVGVVFVGTLVVGLLYFVDVVFVFVRRIRWKLPGSLLFVPLLVQFTITYILIFSIAMEVGRLRRRSPSMQAGSTP
jgi:hypothetical protein